MVLNYKMKAYPFRHLENFQITVSGLPLVLGLSFIVSIHMARLRRRIESPSVFQGFIISIGLSLFIDPGVILIFDIFIPWINNTS